ncbi:MAG TPA: ClbS/DfsB family four-helix bundle protein [Thermomicrobiales bacterium]|nr:ClbS/DfsB family four-helix bundle protein [Thermomicrobiales bacterium]
MTDNVRDHSHNHNQEQTSTLLERINTAWKALQATIDAHSEAELTGPRDAGGWSAKDHLAHLTDWERGVVFLLNGHDFYNGLGVSEETYLSGDLDVVSSKIQEQVKDKELLDVLTDLRVVHEEAIGSISNLTDDDLRKPISGEPASASSGMGTIADKIIGNTSEHFDQHREWIETLIANGAH